MIRSSKINHEEDYNIVYKLKIFLQYDNFNLNRVNDLILFLINKLFLTHMGFAPVHQERSDRNCQRGTCHRWILISPLPLQAIKITQVVQRIQINEIPPLI